MSINTTDQGSLHESLPALRIKVAASDGHNHDLLDSPVSQSIDSEEKLVGSAILDDSIVSQIVDAPYYDPFHRAIVQAASRVQSQGHRVDTTLLAIELRKLTLDPPDGGWVPLLLHLVTNVPHAANWRGYLEDVVADDLRRRLHLEAIQLLQAVHRHEPLDNALLATRESLEKLGRSAGPGDDNPIRTSHALDSEKFTTSYAINGVLSANQPCIMAGSHKVLKTSLVVDMAVSLATHGMFLGYFKTDRPYRTLVMSGESGMPTLQETARRVCRAAGVWLSDIDNLFWHDDVPRLDDPKSLARLESTIIEHGIEVLFIDPLYLALPGADASNLFVQGQLLRRVGELCQKHGTTLILVHHTKKNTGRETYTVPELADIAWSGCQEFARQWILVGRRERYEPGTGSHRLWLNVGGSAGHSGCWAVDIEEGVNDAADGRDWIVSLSSAGEARADATARTADAKAQARDEQAQAILDSHIARIHRAMQETPGGDTKNGINTRCRINAQRFNIAIEAMLQRRLIEPCKVVKPGKNTPHDGFKLTQLEPVLHALQEQSYTEVV